MTRAMSPSRVERGVLPEGVPAVGPPRRRKLPAVSERTLRNGLRVAAVRKPGIPRFEVRLRIPTVRARRAENDARITVLAETLMAGTPERSSVEIAEALQKLGGSLGVAGDADFLTISGSALSTELRPFLELMGEIVRDASFPPEEVAIERERLAQEILLARSQPDVIAHDALAARLFDGHAYGRGTPDPSAVSSVSPAALRQSHATRVLPAGSVLIVVGDLNPTRVLDDVEATLGRWASGGADESSGRRLPAPKVPPTGPAVIVNRAGAVQTNIRLAGFALPRSDPRYPSLMIANAIFGGYFTSRLVDNIRERRGYTYSPHSGVEHRQSASTFTVQADVATEVTAAALVEIHYELGRMVATAVEQAELDSARRYLQGALAMSTQTQAGLSSLLAVLLSAGLDVEFLREYPAALDRVTIAGVREVSEEYLGTGRLVTVLVGDASAIASSVGAVEAVEVRAEG